MLGVERYKVSLVPHDESWADEYDILMTVSLTQTRKVILL